MAVADIREFLKLVPAVQQTPDDYLWVSYGREADVVYVNFKKPSYVTPASLS